MFETVSEKFSAILEKVKGSPHLTEQNIDSALKQVRLSLLEADVNFRVVKNFVESVRQKSLGAPREKGLTAGQQFVKTVKEELTSFLGGENEGFVRRGSPFCVMAAGLQGAGKTTFCAKLAVYFAARKAKPLLVPADVYRPAAYEQLKTLSETAGAGFYEPSEGEKPDRICAGAKQFAVTHGFDTAIFDTAGRLHADLEQMEELKRIKEECSPDEILLVADAMTGQDAVNVAASFNQSVDITGVVLTKMDGDSRGGAALSMRAVTGKPIKFFGTGEKIADLELFHPERIASRILGMGDILTLVEKAEQAVKGDAGHLVQNTAKNRFTLSDFRQSMLAMDKIGSIESIAQMVPGAAGLLKNRQAADRAQEAMKTAVAIVDSMTPRERTDHRIINSSRRKRIARGSGTTVAEVNRTIKNFIKMQSMMKKGSRTGKFRRYM